MDVPVVGIWSTGRLGFNDTWGCILECLPALGIPVVRGTGCFWGQGMEKAMSLAIERLHPRWLLTLDHDSIFEMAQLEELIRIAFDRPEIDALCPNQWHRSEDRPLWGPLEGAEPTATDLDVETYTIRYGHFGLTLIRAAAVEAMPHPWFLESPDQQGCWGPLRTDPDVHFWRRLRSHGARLFVAPRVTIGHIELGIRWPGKDGRTAWQTMAEYQRLRRPPEEVTSA